MEDLIHIIAQAFAERIARPRRVSSLSGEQRYVIAITAIVTPMIALVLITLIRACS